jgi:hypothetical protein
MKAIINNMGKTGTIAVRRIGASSTLYRLSESTGENYPFIVLSGFLSIPSGGVKEFKEPTAEAQRTLRLGREDEDFSGTCPTKV